jgi:hypothetical protein
MIDSKIKQKLVVVVLFSFQVFMLFGNSNISLDLNRGYLNIVPQIKVYSQNTEYIAKPSIDTNSSVLVRTGGQSILVPLIISAVVVFISAAVSVKIKPRGGKKPGQK